MNLTIVGAGYVGLVSSVAFSILGHNVICIDIDQNKINKLKEGKITIYEPELEHNLKACLISEKLKFSSNYSGISESDVVFVAVGTPSLPSGDTNLKFIYQAIENIIQYPCTTKLIVIKSTVPPGTAKTIEEYLHSKNLPFNIASNPEFLREGTAWFDFLKPDRVILGINNKTSLKFLQEIYSPLLKKNNVPIIITNTSTAEIIKYASNVFLANKIAFINEMSDLCEQVNGNIQQLALGIGLDNRIGKEFLKVGPGFGGSCFPKDLSSLSIVASNYNCNSLIVDAVIKSNNQRFLNMCTKIEKIIGTLSNKVLAVLGLTYKPNTDDLRDSPSLKIINILLSKNAFIKAYDP